MSDWDDMDEDERHRTERNALFAAILATMCHMAAVLACCAAPGGIFGIGMGLGSLYLSKQVLDTGMQGTARGYAMVSIVMSTIGILWSGVVLMFVCAYLTLYVGILMAAGSNGF